MRLTQSELIMSRNGSRHFVKESYFNIKFVVAESSFVTYILLRSGKKYFFINTVMIFKSKMYTILCIKNSLFWSNLFLRMHSKKHIFKIHKNLCFLFEEEKACYHKILILNINTWILFIPIIYWSYKQFSPY